MLKAGLTGNVAAGKSTVARTWQGLGATVIDADVLARRAIEPGSRGFERVLAEWGSSLRAPDGTIDRAALRAIVFRDPAARARLEAIIHPEVARLRDLEYDAARARGEPLVVADIPLLFEVGLEREFDVVVLVDAPEPVRLERLVSVRGLDPETARQIVAAQMPAEPKRAAADWVIDNSGSLDELHARAVDVWHQLLDRAAGTPGARDG